MALFMAATLSKLRMDTCRICWITFLVFSSFGMRAQQVQLRPMSITIYPLQGLRFGAFFKSKAGGSIIISATGERTATGDIILTELGYTHGPASFGIVANPGTMINILNGPDIKLAGSDGGAALLHLGSSYPASPFVTSVQPPSFTYVDIGGTLIVGGGGGTPSGSYNGSLFITFVQE